MSPGTLLYVALGGALGSVCRALVGVAITSRLPVGTLVVNGVGSLLIGWLMSRYGATEPATATRLLNVMVVGFCGGFTTFSAFSWQTLDQMLKGQWGVAIGNVVLSVVLCLIAVWMGFRLGRL